MIDGILRVTKQLKQNVASVSTTLVGGQRGYLVLILSDEQWKNIQDNIQFYSIYPLSGDKSIILLRRYY